MVAHALLLIPVLFPLDTRSKPEGNERAAELGKRQLCSWHGFAIVVLEERSTPCSISYSETWQKCASLRLSRALLIYLTPRGVTEGQMCCAASLTLSLPLSRKQKEKE